MRKNSRTLRGFAALVAILLLMLAVPVTAYAGGDDPDETPIIEPLPPPALEPEPAPEPVPLTPPGNLTLVDDVSGEQAGDKQFITVVTKSGNFFYLVIDRASEEENVHFLNLVDEADLQAILEEAEPPAPAPAPIAPPAPEPEPDPEPVPEPEQGNNAIGVVVTVLLLAGLGGGAFYYFKIRKPKQNATASPATAVLDEFAFDEDEEDLSGEYAGEPDFEETPELAEDEPMPDFTFAPEDVGAEEQADSNITG